jgi:hypothetical protein
MHFRPHAGPRRQKGLTVDKLVALLKSRKFWAGAVGIAYVFFGARAGIDEAALISGVATIAAYILGTALEDGLANR